MPLSEFFVCHKKTPPPAKSLFENMMGSQKSNFLICDRNAPRIFFFIEIWAFSFQNCFRNNFLTSGSAQTEKERIMGIMGSIGIFSLITSRSRKLIPKTDLKWKDPYFYSRFFSWSVSIKNEKSKIFDFKLYLKKVILQGGGLFLPIFFSGKS